MCPRLVIDQAQRVGSFSRGTQSITSGVSRGGCKSSIQTDLRRIVKVSASQDGLCTHAAGDAVLCLHRLRTACGGPILPNLTVVQLPAHRGQHGRLQEAHSEHSHDVVLGGWSLGTRLMLHVERQSNCTGLRFRSMIALDERRIAFHILQINLDFDPACLSFRLETLRVDVICPIL